MQDIEIQKLWYELKSILTYSLTASLKYLTRKEGSFHLTGMDFMMDDKLKLYFLEAN